MRKHVRVGLERARTIRTSVQIDTGVGGHVLLFIEGTLYRIVKSVIADTEYGANLPANRSPA